MRLQSSTDHSAALIITALLFQQLLGGLTFPIAKFGLLIIEPFTFAFYRFVLSAVVLLIIVNSEKMIPLLKKKII